MKKSGERLEFQLQLENKEGDGHTTVTVAVEVDEHGRVHPKVVGGDHEAGGKDEYHVSFVVRGGHGGDHCWICLNEPCPPNRPTWFPRCPYP